MCFFSRYVIVYFSILYIRYHAGIVTDEMLSLPKAPYVVVGLLEALGAASGMAAAGNISLLLISFFFFFSFFCVLLFTFEIPLLMKLNLLCMILNNFYLFPNI